MNMINSISIIFLAVAMVVYIIVTQKQFKRLNKGMTKTNNEMTKREQLLKDRIKYESVKIKEELSITDGVIDKLLDYQGLKLTDERVEFKNDWGDSLGFRHVPIVRNKTENEKKIEQLEDEIEMIKKLDQEIEEEQSND